jgi:hypothetical protein
MTIAVVGGDVPANAGLPLNAEPWTPDRSKRDA